MSGSPKKESSGSLGYQYRRVCKNKSFNYMADGGNAGEAGTAKMHAFGVLWRQACFPPGAFGETIGIEIWVGFQGETGWGYHIYEV